jgi:predicted GNAT family N-acyltransferase
MTEIKIVKFEGQYAPVIKAIRNAVFTIEQNIDAGKDLDGEDPAAAHILVKLDGKYVATGRMLNDGHIGRLAVLKASRGKSLGTKIILAFVEEARKRRLKFVYLGAQVHAADFYKNSGFSASGAPYFEVGIEHIQMKRYLN